MGTAIPITVTFSEAVTVTGDLQPRLMLWGGGQLHGAAAAVRRRRSPTPLRWGRTRRIWTMPRPAPGASAQWWGHQGCGGQCGRVYPADRRHGWAGNEGHRHQHGAVDRDEAGLLAAFYRSGREHDQPVGDRVCRGCQWNLVTSDNSSVTMAIGPGSTGSGTLNGLKTVAAVKGVATFSNLSVSAVETYTLTATDGALTAVTSPPFTITLQPSTATKLAFFQPPTTAQVGSTINPPVTVYVEDASGNLVTSDNSSVTVAIGPGSAGSGTQRAEDRGSRQRRGDVS